MVVLFSPVCGAVSVIPVFGAAEISAIQLQGVGGGKMCAAPVAAHDIDGRQFFVLRASALTLLHGAPEDQVDHPDPQKNQKKP